MSNLVIVESPSKAKTVQKYLGPGYEVEASMGHVRDLPKSKLSVDTEHNFEPVYVPMKDKEEVINSLKKAAKKALLTDNRKMYEAYIGKRNVTMKDLQFLYSSGTSKQFLWNVIKESEGNVLVITQK